MSTMKCKSCKNELPDGSIFCMYCGEKQIREKKKKKDEIKVPKPVQLPSGAWRIQLKAEGQSVTEATPELCITKAKAIRAGFVEKKKTESTVKITLDSAIQKYINDNDSVLSPVTLRGYDTIRRTRFTKYLNSDIASVDWQSAINEESKKCSPKTLKNAWGLVSCVMRSNELPVPNIRLPAMESKELAWLNHSQIAEFLDCIKDEPCEIGALLALHSLRRSELLIISPSKIVDDCIIVHGAKVPDKDNNWVVKNTNKNSSSTRTVPIMIPRLKELVEQSENAPDVPYVSVHPNVLYAQINSACRKSGLPEVGIHGLRRSFASLAYHLGWSERQAMAIGGWSDWQTMHKMYIKLDSTDIRNAAEKMEKFYHSTEESQ